MSDAAPEEAPRGVSRRVLEVMLRPDEAWPQVAAQPANIPGLYRGLVGPLAAIPALCGFIGVLLFGVGVFDVGLRPPLGVALAEMATGYVLTLVAVYLLARVVEVLAPMFGGVGDRLRAFKLVAYAGAPLWISGVLLLYPPLGELVAVLGGIYSLNILYRGLPEMMGAPHGRRISFFALVLAAALVLWVTFGAVTTRIRDLGGPLRMAATVQASPT